MLRLLLEDVGAILKGAWRRSRRHWPWLLVGGLALAGLAAIGFGYDADFLPHWQGPRSPERRRMALALSFYGDYPIMAIGTAAVLILLGLSLKRRGWAVAGVGTFLAPSLAGLFVNIFRFGLGRPRPIAHLADGFHGPTIEHLLHGFPSGHSTAAFATAGVLMMSIPRLGWLYIPVAVGVAWSRMYLNQHHPTDVVVGGLLGLSFGLLFGMATRARMREITTSGKAG